jgi:hypothetical protein
MSQVTSTVTRAAKAVFTGGASEVKNYVDNQTQKAQDAADQAAQQQAAADQAAENAGPTPVALREQSLTDQADAAGALRTGNEADVAGSSLFSPPRKRAASRSLGY